MLDNGETSSILWNHLGDLALLPHRFSPMGLTAHRLIGTKQRRAFSGEICGVHDEGVPFKHPMRHSWTNTWACLNTYRSHSSEERAEK